MTPKYLGERHLQQKLHVLAVARLELERGLLRAAPEPRDAEGHGGRGIKCHRLGDRAAGAFGALEDHPVVAGTRCVLLRLPVGRLSAAYPTPPRATKSAMFPNAVIAGSRPRRNCEDPARPTRERWVSPRRRRGPQPTDPSHLRSPLRWAKTDDRLRRIGSTAPLQRAAGPWLAERLSSLSRRRGRRPRRAAPGSPRPDTACCGR